MIGVGFRQFVFEAARLALFDIVGGGAEAAGNAELLLRLDDLELWLGGVFGDNRDQRECYSGAD